MPQHRAKVAIHSWVSDKSLHRSLVAGRALKEKAMTAQPLLYHSLHRAGEVRRDEAIQRAHNCGVAREIDQSRKQLAFQRIETHYDHFMIASSLAIDAEE